ncbi:hypothetical protein [Candidatus Nitronereus thalassa]|uniref:Uncharacterized protein n=1 Tax=Candidatus Nitronereus thalassa TaxID=3020898 RepID=A0ABU3K5S4_9BACT|nr:hypothetical protein [Candidatus Nitronereus thalassa]MDT7041726.1 hypothetical protein [Candidatus Nitronereus thalassa]
MSSQPTTIVALFTALTFTLGTPVFAEPEVSQPAAPPAEQHMGADHAAAPAKSEAKHKKMAKKKRSGKKAKKENKKSGDES